MSVLGGSGEGIEDRQTSRRGFLRLTAAGAVLGTAGLQLLVDACAAPAPSPSPTNASVSAGAVGTARPAAAGATSGLQMPTYVPFAGPPPDYPGTADGVQPAYASYPKNPQRVVKQAPGKGGDITALTDTIAPLPAPMESNAAWQEVNKEVNATLRLNIVPSSDYTAKLNAIIAGNDLPDMVYVNQSSTSPVQNFLSFVQAKAADLTPYLSGDAVKDYPFLANFPPFNWKGTGTVYNNLIYGVPIPRSVLASSLFAHKEVLDAAGLSLPQNGDDFKRTMQAVNRPQQNVWAMAVGTGAGFGVPTTFLQIFKGPNNWRLESSGKLTKSYETDELKAAAGFARDMFQAGLFHPNSGTYTNLAADADFEAGKFVFYGSTWLALSTGYWPVSLNVNPASNIVGVSPLSNDGSKPVFYLGVGNFGNTYINKNASPDRIKELLGVLNYMAAPFGSAEALLQWFGKEGVDFTFDANGNPVATQNGYANNPVPFRYLTQYPATQYNLVRSADYAAAVHKVELDMVAAGIQDPTLGLYSPTFANLNSSLQTAFYDGLADVVTGRRPLTDIDQLVKDWQNNGGEKMRGEYQDALAKK